MADERISALRAMAHPLRVQMLSLLTGVEMSAADVARELGISHANASYHLRTLHQAGHIVVTGQERIRGGVAKRYRYVSEDSPPRPPTRGRRRSREDLVAYAEAVGVELKRRLATAPPTRGQFHSDIEAWVDPEVWAEVVDLLRRASRLLHDGARPPRTAGTRHVSATAWAFAMDDPGVEGR
ncbi:MAG TPA: helix-turn-helix domain-containing protein [Nocardioides sp.]|uniref:ArsR/SmtB family transcription factor n=1 Tax=Nocardioides sp. TaxID=35761 RepID=UPI002F3F8788